MTTDTGDHAFAMPGSEVNYPSPGMTLLDYNATAAMSSVFNNDTINLGDCARYAYDMAEAMVAEKRRREAAPTLAAQIAEALHVDPATTNLVQLVAQLYADHQSLLTPPHATLAAPESMRHALHSSQDHTLFDSPETCPICNGGLSDCTVCGGAESCLPTECPGRKLTSAERDWITDKKIDYRDGAWVDLRAFQ